MAAAASVMCVVSAAVFHVEHGRLFAPRLGLPVHAWKIGSGCISALTALGCRWCGNGNEQRPEHRQRQWECSKHGMEWNGRQHEPRQKREITEALPIRSLFFYFTRLHSRNRNPVSSICSFCDPYSAVFPLWCKWSAAFAFSLSRLCF